MINRVAIPVFQSRISPVFDCCNRVLLVDLEQDREIRRTEITCQDLSVFDRVKLLNESGVTLVICAGISQSFHDQLVAAEISTIPGIVGQVDEVLAAFRCDRLDNSCFCMPGYKTDRLRFENEGFRCQCSGVRIQYLGFPTPET